MPKFKFSREHETHLSFRVALHDEHEGGELAGSFALMNEGREAVLQRDLTPGELSAFRAAYAALKKAALKEIGAEELEEPEPPKRGK